jgi:large subunit ribosomal protein L10
VTELKDKLQNSSIVIPAGFSGMGANQMVDMRRRLRDGGVEFVVVKNNLLEIAADEAGLPQLKDIITGQSGIAVGYEDPVQAAKTVTDAATAGGVLAIHGAIVNQGEAMPPAEVRRLAALPPQPVLVAQLLGSMQSPLYGLLSVLSGPLRSLAYLLQARADQMEQPADAE